MPLLDKLPSEPPDISPVVCESTKPPQKPPEENNKIETPPDTTPDRTPEVNKPSNKAAKHIWFADDSGAAGRLKALKIWWDTLQASGPVYGYFPKPSKTWLIVKRSIKRKPSLSSPTLTSPPKVVDTWVPLLVQSPERILLSKPNVLNG